MDYICFIAGLLITAISVGCAYRKRYDTKKWISIITFGVLVSIFFMVLPTEWSKSDKALIKPMYNIISALLYSFKVLGGRQDISQLDSIGFAGVIRYIYVAVCYASFIAAPVLGSSLVLSFVGDTLSKIRFAVPTVRKTYVFSELNDSSLLIAKGLCGKEKKSRLVFCDTKKSSEADIEKARKLGGITLFKKCDSVRINKPSKNYEFCIVSENEDENVEITIKLIKKYKDKTEKDVNITAFAKSGTHIQLIEELFDVGAPSNINVRFIDKIALFCNNLIFENPLYNTGEKGENISVMIVGCGETGMRMLRTVAWGGQIDGYSLKIRVYDKKARDIEKAFNVHCPELNPNFGYDIEFIETDVGAGAYEINEKDTEALDFETVLKASGQLTDATIAYVFAGDDELNIDISERLFRIFRKGRGFGKTPPIFTWVDEKSKFDLFSGSESYLEKRNINLVGSVENIFAQRAFFNSKLENLALAVHLSYKGKLKVSASSDEYAMAVKSFKNREYDRRSSMATAIHIAAKLHSCGILNTNEAELTDEKALDFSDYIIRHGDDMLRLAENEHLRWNAFMRSEGFSSAELETAQLYSKYNNSHKDELTKLHTCITDWDSLEQVEDFCKRVLNEDSPFRKYDFDIVRDTADIILLANKLTREEQ